MPDGRPSKRSGRGGGPGSRPPGLFVTRPVGRPFGRPSAISRRTFLQGVAATAVTPPLLAACGGDEEESSPTTAAPEEVGAPSTTVFEDPASALSGDLRILMWSHFVPSHDEWFDQFAREWGEEVGVNVSVDHINTADVPGQITSQIAAGSGHDLIQHIGAIPQFEPSVIDMVDVVSEAENRYGELFELCRKSSFNPNTEKYFAYSPGWAPDPGNYRRSLWEAIDMPDGPSTWDELLEGGSEIRSSQGTQLGIGMSQEIDSNMAGLALMWSFGASVQDEDENVVINSPETIAAVEYMSELFSGAMTDEVFAWNAASNNQGLVAGSMSYILNSISAYRTAQEENPVVAEDVFFVPALEGPATALAAQHVIYNWIVPDHAANPTPRRSSCSTTQPTTTTPVTTRSSTTSRRSSIGHPTSTPGWGRIRLARSRPTNSRSSRGTTRSSGRRTSATRDRPTPRLARCSARTSSRTCSRRWPAAR